MIWDLRPLNENFVPYIQIKHFTKISNSLCTVRVIH